MGHVSNWYAGWALLLTGFGAGALIGLGFWRDTFMGGYQSWPRRMVRLGHIALAALGILNIAYGVAAWPAAGTWQAQGAGLGLIAGGIAMPAVCFLSAWRKPLRHLFPLPVTLLAGAAACVLAG